LRDALLALSRLDREAVLLTAWFDLSSADAAQALGITPAAFRMRAARARRRLRAAYEITTKERTQWNTTT
jgi:RNA polymerase sigma-70 factor (ECF subfamily)